MTTRWVKWVVVAVVGVVVLAVGGTWVYINLIREDAPERLTLDAAGDRPETTATTTPAAATPGAVDGTWRVTTGSQAGYRVKEILFGQDAEAVGRTSDVTGEFEIDGTTVAAGSFSVDMTTVTSDQSRRDNQFRGRIMDVATYPTATFELTEPIVLGTLPADGEQVTVSATGNLTLRGTTKPVRLELAAQRAGDAIRVAGNLTIVFGEWDIPNPSFGPAETEDHGELEFLLVFAR